MMHLRVSALFIAFRPPCSAGRSCFFVPRGRGQGAAFCCAVFPALLALVTIVNVARGCWLLPLPAACPDVLDCLGIFLMCMRVNSVIRVFQVCW